ncbi:MFS general substrate transporter [Mycena floridula]|nr:MFS general substrate transporter [Mycena floridula]
MTDIEKIATEDRLSTSSVEKPVLLKLDGHGLPLVPQPSNDKNDPLNWPWGKKMIVLTIMSILAFFGSFNLAVMNPAYAQVAIALNVTVMEASYIGTISIAGGGVACFLWVPIANVYGRRPVLVAAQILAVCAGFGSAFATSYRSILVARVFVGLGHGAAFVLTAVVMSDIFCLHERGKMIGIATVALVNGPHVASLPGGFVAQFISWRWTLILPSIIAASCLPLLLVAFPETLYLREGSYPTGRDTFWGERKLWGFRPSGRKLRAVDFFRPIQMLKYPPIVACALYAGVAFTLGSVMPAQTVSALFRTYYNWHSAHTGVALSLSTTIGGVLGELFAGPVTDRLILASRMKAQGRILPERRLHAMWPGAVLLPIGLVIFGLMIRFHELKNSWVGVCIAMGTTCFATQIIVTPAIAYVVDCYKGQAAQAVQILNFTRQMMGFTVGFWSLRFGDEVGFQFSGLTYALVTILFYIPVMIIMRYGERIRMHFGQPNFDVDL